jgi:hypothetical protein
MTHLSLSSRPERALERSERARGVERPCVPDGCANLRTAARTVIKILVAAVREIFDEAAYARFLERAKMESSRAAYAAFCRETEAAKSQVHRCC